ncbi:hypothetical protein D3H64_04730 [Atopobacter sp. AH10]|uniref:YozE family protein n=1 Tax=Atopobacter sp. AH10 TaxID=2315861 RepID=UPI000EF2823E|nr:sterile alpha motif-like domain-containing protein [Atopobacter sp. AH10]RLK63398.1 hypothetical protein D3H64_04730 [Atopobacter sp. AH10]
MKSFYDYMMRYQNDHQFCDEMAKFANMMHEDSNFPKQVTKFSEISEYLELSSEYSAFIDVFDKAWQAYDDSGYSE